MSLLKKAYLKLAYPEPPPGHGTLEPMIETGSVHTRFVLLLARIVDTFRLSSMEPPAAVDLVFTVYRADGQDICRHRVDRHPLSQTYVWESRTIVPRDATPLEGTVHVEGVLYDARGNRIPEEELARAWSGDKFAAIVEFTSDWYGDGTFITTSHQNIAVKAPVWPPRRAVANSVRALNDALPLRRFVTSQRARPGAIAVFNDDTFESSLLYYTWLERARPKKIWAELRNADGEALRASLPPLPPKSFSRLRLSELFPESRAFLRGSVGHLLLDRPAPLLTANPRFYVQTTHRTLGTYGIDHSYFEYESSPSFTPKDAWSHSGKGLHSPSVIIESAQARTGLVLFNMVDVSHPKTIGILVYDQKGALIVDKRPAVELPPHGVKVAWIRDLLDEVGHHGDFVGHAEALYCMDVDPYPDMLHHQVLYVQPGMVEGVQHYVGLWNSPTGWHDDRIADPQDLGKRPIYAPAYATSDYVTSLGLTNCSHAWEYDVEAEVDIILMAGGVPVETGTIRIPPHGMYFEPIDRLFPAAQTRLAPHSGLGVVEIRPKNVRTLGAQYFHVQRATGQFSSEHTL